MLYLVILLLKQRLEYCFPFFSWKTEKVQNVLLFLFLCSIFNISHRNLYVGFICPDVVRSEIFTIFKFRTFSFFGESEKRITIFYLENCFLIFVQNQNFEIYQISSFAISFLLFFMQPASLLLVCIHNKSFVYFDLSKLQKNLSNHFTKVFIVFIEVYILHN